MPYKVTFKAKVKGQKAKFSNPDDGTRVSLGDGESMTFRKKPELSKDFFNIEEASLTIRNEGGEKIPEPEAEKESDKMEEGEVEPEMGGATIGGSDAPVEEAKPKKKKKKKAKE